MTTNSTSPIATESQFRSAIQRQLRNNGIFDEITATVRSHILLCLRNATSDRHAANDPVATSDRTTNSDSCNHLNLEQMALQSLIYHYLDHQGMIHTLSVFSAESGMERRNRSCGSTHGTSTRLTSCVLPLSSVDAIKALGLDGIWNDWRNERDRETKKETHQTDETWTQPSTYSSHKISDGDQDAELTHLLRAVAQLASSTRGENVMSLLSNGSMSTAAAPMVSISVQTDTEWVAHFHEEYGTKCNKENVHSNSNSSHQQQGANVVKSFEQRLIEIEQECQQRMKQEMNEKLRLSAKKQAIQAMRHLEQRYKAEIKALKDQLELERTQSQRRHEELLEKESRQQLSMQRDRSELEHRVQSIQLEKQTLESEIGLLHERVRDMQQRRLKDWTEEHEIIAHAHTESMNELEQQKHRLQKEINDIARQRDSLRAKEMKCESLEQEQKSWASERGNLMAEIEFLRQQQTTSLQNNESIQQALCDCQLKLTNCRHELHAREHTFKQERFNLQSELMKMEERYEGAKSDLEKTNATLDSTRGELASLRALLRQSQSALESVSFHEEEDPRCLVTGSSYCHRSKGWCHQKEVERLNAPFKYIPIANLSVPQSNNQVSSIKGLNHERIVQPKDNTCSTIPKASDTLVIESINIVSAEHLKHITKNLNWEVNDRTDHHQLLQPAISKDPPCTSVEDPPDRIAKKVDRDSKNVSPRGDQARPPKNSKAVMLIKQHVQTGVTNMVQNDFGNISGRDVKEESVLDLSAILKEESRDDILESGNTEDVASATNYNHVDNTLQVSSLRHSETSPSMKTNPIDKSDRESDRPVGSIEFPKVSTTVMGDMDIATKERCAAKHSDQIHVEKVDRGLCCENKITPQTSRKYGSNNNTRRQTVDDSSISETDKPTRTQGVGTKSNVASKTVTALASTIAPTSSSFSSAALNSEQYSESFHTIEEKNQDSSLQSTGNFNSDCADDLDYWCARSMVKDSNKNTPPESDKNDSIVEETNINLDGNVSNVQAHSTFPSHNNNQSKNPNQETPQSTSSSHSSSRYSMGSFCSIENDESLDSKSISPGW